jgi:hypothetical protein
MLSHNDKEILLYRILSGKTSFVFDNEKYTLINPSLTIKYEAALLYNNIVNEEKYYEWFREENVEHIMIGLGLWNFETNKNLKMLEQKLDNLKVELFTNFMIPSKTKNIRSSIKTTKNSINKIYATKQNFLSNTLEGYANSIKHEYIICNTLYKNNNLVFDINQDYGSFSLFNSLVQEIDKLMITTENFKELARDNIWRNYWNSCSKNELFDEPTVDLSDEQRALINISKMYDNIYEHPECPSEQIIEDDDALDGWMIVQKRKNEAAKKQNAFDSNNKNNNMKKAGEVFVMAESKDDAESIIEMNTLESKMLMNEKLSYVNSQTEAVNDGDLPDVQRTLRQKISEMNKNNRKK